MSDKKIAVERVQTGVRLEKRMLKVLRALADYFDISMSELLESIVLHALDHKLLPIGEHERQVIADLKQVYGLDLDSSASHNMIEMPTGRRRRPIALSPDSTRLSVAVRKAARRPSER